MELGGGFTWHPGKAASNLRKHQVEFTLASTVFGDPLARSKEDEEHSYDENRWVRIGRAEDGQLLVVVHTIQEGDEAVRIISARRATRRERDDYERAEAKK